MNAESFKFCSRPIEDSAKSARLSERLACMINSAMCVGVCVSVTLGLSSFASPLFFFVNDTVAPGKSSDPQSLLIFFSLFLSAQCSFPVRCVHFNFDCSHRHGIAISTFSRIFACCTRRVEHNRSGVFIFIPLFRFLFIRSRRSILRAF